MAYPAPQGSQVYVGGLCRGLVSAGHEVSLAVYGHGAGPWPEGVRRVAGPAVPGAGTASGPRASKLAGDVVLGAAVLRALRRQPFDVLHAHHVEAPVIAALLRRLGSGRPPLLYTPHTSLEEELPVYLPGAVRRLAARAGAVADRAVPRWVDGSIALSPRSAAQLRAWGADRVWTVTPGVDPAEVAGGDAARARSRWSLDARPWVLYAGNVDPYQDLDVLVAAMERLPEAGLLLVTGAGSARVADALPAHRRRVVTGAGIGEVRDALAACAVATLPRAVCAGYPIKLLNQLAAGRVTVAAAGSAQPIAGVVAVPDRDPVAMADTIRSLIEDPARCRALGEAGAAAVHAEHTLDHATARLVRAYRDALGRR